MSISNPLNVLDPKIKFKIEVDSYDPELIEKIYDRAEAKLTKDRKKDIKIIWFILIDGILLILLDISGDFDLNLSFKGIEFYLKSGLPGLFLIIMSVFYRYIINNQKIIIKNSK
jgi:hypothetical protein